MTNPLIEHVKEFSNLLSKCSVWHNSKEILAPILGVNESDNAKDCYLYEFYCYIALITDLQSNYEIEFIKGVGQFEYKFPQSAANKKGKPRFNVSKGGNLIFQVCAGTKVKCDIPTEENHPDISFQLPNASDDPSWTDLICIMDAKFKEVATSSLPKTEIYKFAEILNLYHNPDPESQPIQFAKFHGMWGNCLITNALAHYSTVDCSYLTLKKMKEVEKFFPESIFRVIG